MRTMPWHEECNLDVDVVQAVHSLAGAHTRSSTIHQRSFQSEAFNQPRLPRPALERRRGAKGDMTLGVAVGIGVSVGVSVGVSCRGLTVFSHLEPHVFGQQLRA